METKIFSYSFIVKEEHLDSFWHVNNAVYLKLFEDARWVLITENGFGIDKIKETGLGPTILEITIKFLKELRLNETIVIQTQMVSYKKKVGKLSQKMIRNNEVCCEAEFTIALFDMNERKLILPTKEWLQALGIVQL